jgi:hypothetical protein
MPVPDRSGLPPLDRYARYVADGHVALAGYVEASRGCLHTCRHCPVVPVYGGRFFVVPVETVLEDISQQVAAGATHITFGDPDFLNGPGHALKVARTLHERFPRLTFDFTAKVEHIRKHRRLLAELRQLGATFVISAFESTSAQVLARLNKGHTPADLDEALDILATVGLAVQPTWVPFTPWTTMDDFLAMLEWIRGRGLIGNVPAVQYTIRLLVPPASALLAEPETREWLGPLEPAAFAYRWSHPDPCMDALHAELTELAAGLPPDHDPLQAFAAVEEGAYDLAGRPRPYWTRSADSVVIPPRLTEDWFC